MNDLISYILLATVNPPLISWIIHVVLRSPRAAFYAGWVTGALYGAGYLAWDHQWMWMGIAAGNVLLAVILWWRHRRRRRKRAPRAYGAKSRALIAALVRKAREAARPRPVPQPVPNPA